MKKLLFVLGVFLVITLVAVACAQPAPAPAASPAPSAAPTTKPTTAPPAAGQIPAGWPKEAVFGGGPAANTTAYLMAAYFSNLLQKEYGIRSTPLTSSSEEGVLAAGKGEWTAAQVTGPVPEQAIKGTDSFAQAGPQPVRLLFNFADIFWNYVALRSSGIKTMADVKGKKLSADSKGTIYVTWVNLEVLAAYGFSEKDVSIGSYGKQNEACTNVQSRVADVGAFAAPVPTGFVTEFATTNDVIFLPLSEQARKRVTDKWSWAFPTKIPANTYKGQTEDVPALNTCLGWAVNKDLPDDLAYQLLKYCYDTKYRADFEKVSAVIAKESTLKRAVQNAFVPFHAGAVKFFKDNGVWTPELEKFQADQLKKLGATR